MMLGSNLFFGLSVSELALLAVGLAYVVSLGRDWRPMKSMRSENRDLRADLNAANRKIEDLEEKVHDLEKAAVPVLQAELVSVARILDRVGKHLDKLDHSVKANTAAVEVLGKRKMIDEALGES